MLLKNPHGDDLIESTVKVMQHGEWPEEPESDIKIHDGE
jgi:hypothetical protein